MSTHLGTTAFLETPTVNGQDVLLNGGGVPVVQSGSVLPTAGTSGRLFFNTSDNTIYRDTGAAWVRESSPVIQTVTGSITATSSNASIPFDNSTPTSTEGFQIWSQSFTPLRADSTIVIITNSFFTVNSAADVWTTAATFNGTTCIGAQMLGFTTTAGHGGNFSMITSHTSGSTAARTYSCRIGGSVVATVAVGQGVAGQNYGSTTNSGRFTITEIAP